ncbi:MULTISPECIES: hypothetical protein [unclassified Streptomyces]|uniref:Uncharacterized protein n=1 Tax=Streptomyces sp. 900105245 TaxID=3154379 RepID=A0ABV1UIV4_9ACTN
MTAPLPATARSPSPSNSGDHTTVTAFAGFWGVGQPATLQIGDIRVFSS